MNLHRRSPLNNLMKLDEKYSRENVLKNSLRKSLLSIYVENELFYVLNT